MPQPPNRNVSQADALIWAIEAEECRRSLKTFLKSVWHIFEPREFVDGLIIDVLCSHLEAVTRGDIRYLLINVPPRHSKSSIISVVWPLWGWLQNPSEQFLCSSFNLNLAIRDNTRKRRIIEDNWFQERFGTLFQLSDEQNLKQYFTNNHNGHQQITSTNGSTTGLGGSVLICLDGKTKIQTQQGELAIQAIVDGQIRTNVLSYNHTTGRAEYKPIVSYMKHANQRKCVRVLLNDGNSVECTEDHRFYVDAKGYIPAKDLQMGDIVLYEHNRSQQSSPDDRMCGMWEDSEGVDRREPILLKALRGNSQEPQWGIRTEGEGAIALSSMWKSIFSVPVLSKQAEILLLHMLSLGSTFVQQWRAELELYRRWMGESATPLQQRVQTGYSPTSQRTRWSEVCDVWNDEGGTRQGVRRSPHRLQQTQQRHEQPHHPLQILSQPYSEQRNYHAILERVPVLSVEPIATIETVYNIEVHENHNYIANGILLKNCDDPHNVDEAYSDVERQSAVIWFRESWSNRMNNPSQDRMVVVGQRVHEDDVSGYIMRERPDWDTLILPAYYEPSRKCSTSIGWEDPRKQEGELLWPQRFPKGALEGLKRDLGSTGFASQYQQSPVPSGGAVFQEKWFRYFRETDEAYLLETPQGVKSVLKSSCWTFGTSDLAISSKQEADYTVFAVWAVTPANDLLLLHVTRDRFSNAEQIEQLQRLHLRFAPDFWKVETVAYQLAFFQQALNLGIPCKEYRPVKDKVSRASTASVWCENGKTYWRAHADWLGDWETEHLRFPKGGHDDQVDVHSQATEEIVQPASPYAFASSTTTTSNLPPTYEPEEGEMDEQQRLNMLRRQQNVGKVLQTLGRIRR